jgi:hypothetical protein
MKTAEAKVQYPDSKDSIIASQADHILRLETTIASQAALLAQKDAQIEQLLLKYEGLQRQHTTLQHQIERNRLAHPSVQRQQFCLYIFRD